MDPDLALKKWILNDDREIVEVDLMTWAEWFEGADRHLAKTQIREGAWVSTVFLGLDHRFHDKGPPLLFETMTFDADGKSMSYSRASSWSDAEAMHNVAVRRVKENA